MLQPTSPVILVEYSQDKKAKILTETSIYQKKNQKNDTLDNLNTIKIDFAKMYQEQCSGQIGHKKYSECECGAILTVEQEKEVRRNNQLNVQQQKMKEIVWCCRYCKKENLSKEIYFLESNTKILLDKNTQRGYLPPILLFLVDISGSMGQSITMSNKEKLPVPKSGQSESSLLCASKQIIQMIQKSTFIDKQSHKVEQFRQRFGHGDQLMQVSNKDKIETINYYSKIVLFMSIVENYLKKIKTQSQYSEFRVGFVFFNESVFIMKPTKQKTIPTFVHHSNSFKKQFPFEKNLVNFNCYEDLFNAGQKMERFFGDSRLKTHDFSKLMVENIDTEGQTALGPAIALALGITSAHDIGSRIVLVSDAMPNIGILSSDTKKQNQKNYQKISKFLELHQTTVGIFNWMTQQSQSLSDKYQSDFGRFVKSNKERVVEISIDLSLRQNHVEVLHTARKSLQNLINRGSIGEVLSIKLFTSNPKVEANKQKYDDANFRFVKFLGFSKKNWIQLKLKKLDEQDFMFPIYTQVVVKYEDILKKQKYVYMSYIVQRIVNVSQSIGANVQITKATQKSQQQYQQILGYMKQGNKSHIKELMNLQKLFNFETQKIVLESVASRNFQEMSLKMGDKYDLTELQFSKNSLNSLAALNNQRNRDDSDQDEIYL